MNDEQWKLILQVQNVVREDANWLVSRDEKYVQASELEGMAIWIDDDAARKIVSLVEESLWARSSDNDVITAMYAASVNGVLNDNEELTGRDIIRRAFRAGLAELIGKRRERDDLIGDEGMILTSGEKGTDDE